MSGQSWSYFYRREGAWSPPWGGAPGTLIIGVTEWPTQALTRPSPKLFPIPRVAQGGQRDL